MENLLSLNLANNLFETIEPQLLADMSLQEINLSNNMLVDLDEELIKVFNGMVDGGEDDLGLCYITWV